jgi:hypothetical protein
MALLPKDWVILSSEEGNQNSRVRFAQYDEKSGNVGFGSAEFWREPDISEFGEKSPHPMRDEEWGVDPEHGFGLSLEDIKKVLEMWPEERRTLTPLPPELLQALIDRSNCE